MPIASNADLNRVYFAGTVSITGSTFSILNAVDTAASPNGIYFFMFAEEYGSGSVSMSFKQSDSSDGTNLEEIGLDNLVYGRDDGKIPYIDSENSNPEGTYLAREGLVGTKRYIYPVVTGVAASGITISVVGVLSPGSNPTFRDGQWQDPA